MRVLLIEDDANVAASIELMLGKAGFAISATGLGEEGLELAMNYDYDVVLLDRHLPDLSGLQVIRKLRNNKIQIPILVLSGDSAIEVRVEALGAGADDYMTKPFHREELIARLKTVIRRAHSHVRSTISVGDLMIDLDTKTASVAGIELALTTKEYQMLEVLCLRKGMTLSKDTLLNHLYGGMDEPEPKIIDVFICKLRKKIATATHGPQYIRTVWGRGYQVAEPSALDLAA